MLSVKTKQLGLIFASFVVVMVSYSIALGLGTLLSSNNMDFFFGVMGLSQFLFLLAPAVFFAQRQVHPLQDTFRLKPPKENIVYLWAFLALVGIQLFSNGIIPLQNSVLPEALSNSFREMYSDYLVRFRFLMGEPNLYNVFFGTLAIAFSPGISEELVFRGFLQKGLERNLGFRAGLIITSFLFAFIHFSVETFLPLLLAGFVLGYFAFKTRSIFPSMFIHILFNASSIISYYANYETGLRKEIVGTTNPTDIALYFIMIFAGLALIFFTFNKINSLNSESSSAENEAII